MELVQQLAPYLLLFHVLCPFVIGILVLSLYSQSESAARRLALATQLLLAGSAGVLLLAAVWGAPDQSAPFSEIGIHWDLPTFQGNSGLMQRVVWGLVPGTAAFFCLLPWIGISVQAFTPKEQQSTGRTCLNLMLLGTLGLFVAGRDVGSLLAGAFGSVLILAALIARNGLEQKRSAAGMFLSMQTIGIFLFAGGLAMFVASASLVRSAPHGLPGASSTSLPELIAIIQTAVHQHPAAMELWGAYRFTPSLLMLCGIVIMGAGFPFQVWMSEVGESASLGERLWLVVWVKGCFLVGLSLLNALDPAARQDFAWAAMSLSVPGALFVSSLLLSQAYLPRLQSSGLVWTQQMTLIATFSVFGGLNSWLTSLLVSQTATIVLLTVALTLLSERYSSIEISAFQGLSARWGWVTPLLLVCTLTLTLTPLGLGLMQLWQATATLIGEGTWLGSLNRLFFYLANVLALAGMARITRQLATGPLRLPEMSPGLWERTNLPEPTATLSLNRWQGSLLVAWSVVAVVIPLVYPLAFGFFVAASENGM